MWAFGAPPIWATGIVVLGAPPWAAGLVRLLEDVGVRAVLVDAAPQRSLAAKLERAAITVREPLAVDPDPLLLELDADFAIAAGPTGAQARLQARHFARTLGRERVRCAEGPLRDGPRGLFLGDWTCAKITGAWDMGWRFAVRDFTTRQALHAALKDGAAFVGVTEIERGLCLTRPDRAPKPEPRRLALVFTP